MSLIVSCMLVICPHLTSEKVQNGLPWLPEVFLRGSYCERSAALQLMQDRSLLHVPGAESTAGSESSIQSVMPSRKLGRDKAWWSDRGLYAVLPSS